MPSSLTIVLPIALVFSTRPPVSVWGTGTVPTHCWAFLGSMESMTSQYVARHRVSALRLQLSSEPAYTLTRGLPSPRFTYPPASPFSYPPGSRSVRSPEGEQPQRCPSWAWRGHGGTGILTSCASTTPFGLALAPDSPWGDQPSPGTLGLSAEGFLTPLSLLMPAFSLDAAPRALPGRLHCNIDAPLPLVQKYEPVASALNLAPLHCPRRITRPVSYYALFQGWLLLSQPPGCLCNPTSFST